MFWSSKTNSVYTDRKEHRWERDAGSGNADSRADSQNKEAAYLFVQWLQSPEISGEWVKLQYALRDPYCESHFNDEGYQSLWPKAPQYLEVLRKGAETGVHDLGIPGEREYEEALDRAIAYAGGDSKAALDCRRARRTNHVTQTRLSGW